MNYNRILLDEPNMKQPILSICIPTYNRAEYLREGLDTLVNDPDFNEQIEIVISDNASTDNTKEIGESYASKYSNIHYYRNDKNLYDRNFEIVLKRASGKYLKLANDTLRFKPGVLKLIIETIQHNPDKPVIFTYVGNSDGQLIHVNNYIELVKLMNINIGWIGLFGILGCDIDCLTIPQKYYDYKFPQVAWIGNIVNKHKGISIKCGTFYDIHNPKQKGGYNLFKVQITNLFSIFKDYGLKGIDYEKVKYKAFRTSYMLWIRHYLIDKEPIVFDLSGSWRTLFKEYCLRPYFIPIVAYNYLKYFNTKLKKNE